MCTLQRCFIVLLLGMLIGITHVSAATQPRVRVLHNSFVSAEKFQRIAPLAAKAGIAFEAINVETSDSKPASWLADADLVMLDTPRPNDRAMIEQMLGTALKTTTTPVIGIGGGAPLFIRVAPQVVGPLTRYYAAGGADNIDHLLTFITAWHRGQSPDTLPPATTLPATGFYHPQAPQLFTQLNDYLHWYTHRNGMPKHAPADRQGVIGFVTHSSIVSDMVTTQVDRLIAKTEDAGMIPVVFWFDGNNPAGLPGVLGHDQVDVLVNLTHLQNGAARSADFLTLDIPVIQTTRFREGTMADWADAHSGVGARSAAVFLAVPENWGVMDPIVLSAQDKDVDTLIEAQADLVIGKAGMLAKLRHTPPADKKLALLFWNYPAGEKNLAASNLNVPRSIVSVMTALSQAGYNAPVVYEQTVIRTAQTLLGALYKTVSLSDLLHDNLAALLPVTEYEQWLKTLPAKRQAEIAHWGTPARHWAVRNIDDVRYFVIPRWQAGNVLLMPQMPRSAHVGDHYHDMESAPDHLYLASYLYLQKHYAANALIHFGTHGTQEWLPGKDRGLAATDYPLLAVGNVPVFYPYIQDNVGEAIQAKRRGRAVIVSHQTPPFAPAGLYDTLRDLHHLIHTYMQLDDGAAKDTARQQIIDAAVASHMHEDLGYTKAAIQQTFEPFLQVLHDHMHELARVAMPLGLHTFGQPAIDEHRLTTVMQQLGQPFYDVLGVGGDELFVDDFSVLSQTRPYRILKQMLDPASSDATLPVAWQPFAQQARLYYNKLADTGENEALLAGLAGRFVAPGAGGDPIRTPEIASGRNLYAFEADKLPAQAAYIAGEQAYMQLIEAYRAANGGAYPTKLAFSLWSSEAIRHLGVTESQVLHALGLRPVWDKGGRVVDLAIIPAAELKRPRVDVVVQVTSVYRDQFDHFMRLLATAIERIAKLKEANNPVAMNQQRIANVLQQQGVGVEEAQRLANYRIFSSASGAYGTGLPDMAMQSTKWDDDSVLAERFLTTTQYAYGRDGWGEKLAQGNLFAEQLKGVQAAVMSRSSNVHGVLSTDHPFEFLGGLSLAVRHLDGKAPALFISDLRTSNTKTTSLARFLSDEMRVRYLNPQWIQGMQKEGYAGTLAVLNVTNNLFGWQVTDPSVVRNDQWQAMFDTYVNDTRDLGISKWFETNNPTAQGQMLERMAEAIRKEYWQASDDTKRALVKRWQTLEAEHDVTVGEPATRAFVAALAAGFGMEAGSAPPVAAAPAQMQTSVAPMSAPAQTSAPTITQATPSDVSPEQASDAAEEVLETVQGQVLQAVEKHADNDDAARVAQYLGGLFMLLLVVGGAVWQRWRNRQLRAQSENTYLTDQQQKAA